MLTGPVPPAMLPGTTATICELLQLVMDDGGVPFNATVLLPCVSPNTDPAIVTDEPGVATDGDTLTTKGATPVNDTLSNVAVARLELLPLVTANPM